MKDRKVIVETKKKQNLFTLDLTYPEKAMVIIILKMKVSPSKSKPKYLSMALTGYECPIYLVNKNKHIRLWYQRLVHISNTRVLRVAKLVSRIKLDR